MGCDRLFERLFCMAVFSLSGLKVSYRTVRFSVDGSDGEGLGKFPSWICIHRDRSKFKNWTNFITARFWMLGKVRLGGKQKWA